MDTKYEKARIIGARALQISLGAPFMTKIGKKELEEMRYNPVKIAMQEYDAGVVPMTIKRPMPDTRKKVKVAKEKKE
ncbi:MAG: DNA-directed RNA polymerase subunit K [Candidatus Woesearchaeota archaeon]|nr:DNA-directed RNA polymerase subunit K [Candidatus Woesearchaeota archaeon]